MFALRLVYEVREALRYSGHLDIAGELARWLRRARANVQYTEGFNPHPRMSFAPPKPVGIVARNELADIYLDSLNPLPDIQIGTGFKGLSDGAPSFETASFSYPNSIDITTADSEEYRQDDGFRFGTNAWFDDLADSLVSNSDDRTRNENDLSALERVLSARSHPLLAIRHLRILSAADYDLAKAIDSALYFVRLVHLTDEDASTTESWLKSDRWLVERKPGDKPADMHQLALDVAMKRDGKQVDIGVLGYALASRTFSVMRIVNHCVRNFGSVPLYAVRLGFFDKHRKPVS